MKKLILTSIAALSAVCMSAETVAFSENFDGDYSDNFPTVYDGDGLLPQSSIQSLFLGTDGIYMPWWVLKDSQAATDRYIASHSMYSPVGKSNDWLCSRAIEIPTTGFTLSFDANSYVFNQDDSALSTLWLFITETPLDSNNLPTEATKVFENVPVGSSYEEISGDWVPYTVNLDEYAGKTIYLNFANLNEDKDILALDNIKVARPDKAELKVEDYESLIVDDTYTITAEIEAVEAVDNWTLTLSDGVGEDSVQSGEAIAVGDKIAVPFTRSIEADKTVDFTLSLVADGREPITVNGSVTRLTFEPFRKVLVEEFTGSWCGNCPLGNYTVESMLEDEEMGKYVVPVAIHITRSGGDDYTDMMANFDITDAFGVTAAPMLRINRGSSYVGVGYQDYNFNKENSYSFAYRVVNSHKALTNMEISVEATPVIEGNDTTGILCRTTLRPALSMKGHNYHIGYYLTENSVGMNNVSYWDQTNYFSGTATESKLGGWTELPGTVHNLRYNDVARTAKGLVGVLETIPSELEAGEEYVHEEIVSIPDTERYLESSNGTRIKVAEPIHCSFLNAIAFIVDYDTMEVMNVDTAPVSENAEVRLSISGVNDLIYNSAEGTETIYYDLQGRRVNNPEAGIYIRKSGTSVKKVVVD